MSQGTLRRDDAVSRVEEILGDPMRDTGPFSYKTAVALDEDEQRPSEQYELLNTWGLAEHYVPATHGGQLSSLESFSLLMRALARRNLSVAIGHGITFLGCVHGWAFGTDQQKRRLADTVRRGGLVALAYHEKHHGSDFLASDTTIRRAPDGYRLTGEKWLVNAATESVAMSLFASCQDRQAQPEGAILLLFKEDLPTHSFRYLPRSKPLGVRGVDFSGIAFDDCPVPADALIGGEGAGLTQTLTAFQVTRAVIPALSLGALEAGIELVLAFASRRTLYRSGMLSLPYVRSQLADAFGDLMAMEALQRAVARSSHILPDSLRLWSAVAKFVIPALVDDALKALGELLGARAYLREEHCHGMFQKIVRDHAVVRIFHGGSFQLLQTVGLLRGLSESAIPDDDLRATFALGTDLPQFDWSRLAPAGRNCVEPVRLLEQCLSRSRAGHDDTALRSLASETRAIGQQLRALRRSLKSVTPGGGLSRGFYERTKQQCWLQAAAIVALTALEPRDESAGMAAVEGALALGLARLLNRAWPARSAETDAPNTERAYEELVSLRGAGLPLGLGVR
jgi:alkylation response protein AidB-like acyl-CoA dehydrogenase